MKNLGKIAGGRPRLLAAISVLGVSLGMGAAHADTTQDTSKPGTQQSLKLNQNSLKTQDSIKSQNSLKNSSQLKIDSNQQKGASAPSSSNGW